MIEKVNESICYQCRVKLMNVWFDAADAEDIQAGFKRADKKSMVEKWVEREKGKCPYTTYVGQDDSRHEKGLAADNCPYILELTLANQKE